MQESGGGKGPKKPAPKKPAPKKGPKQYDNVGPVKGTNRFGEMGGGKGPNTPAPKKPREVYPKKRSSGPTRASNGGNTVNERGGGSRTPRRGR